MATMSLRISGSKSKTKVVRKINATQPPFPSHCVEFFNAHKRVAEEFSSDNIGRKLFNLITEAHSSEEVLQEIKELTRQDWPNNLPKNEVMAGYKFLALLYLLADYQGHIKNAILRMLENGSKDDDILSDMTKILKEYLICGKGKIDDQTLAAGTVIHLTKSSVLAEKFIFPCWIENFQLIDNSVQSIGTEFKSFAQLSAVEQQVLFNSLHVSSQAAVSVLQLANKKSSCSLGALQIVQHLFQELSAILSDPPSQLPSDTLNSCAMAALLCSDRILEGTEPVEKIMDVLGIILDKQRVWAFSEWSLLKNCSVSVKFSLGAAMLGIYKVEDLSQTYLDGQYFLEAIFDYLVVESGKSSDSSAILSGSRAIAALGRILPQASILHPEILRSLLPRAVDHCVVYLEHHMDSVRHATKAFLTSLLSACQKVENCFSAVLESFKALHSDSKAKFFGVAALGTSLGSAKVLEEFEDVVQWLLKSLNNTTLAPHACSTLEVLMKNHIRPDVPEDVWCNTWIAPMVLMMPCSALDSVIAKAVQIRPQTLSYIVNICSKELSGSTPTESTNRLKVLLSCLTMAKKHSAGSDWMSVINIQKLTFALCHSEDEVKLAALTLLVESRKSTEPFTPIEMMSIITGLKYCGDTELPSTSHAAISILKKLLSRLADSHKAVASNSSLHESYTGFAGHICENAFSNLFPGASICRRGLSLQTLCLFKEILSGQSPWAQVWKKQLTAEHSEPLLACLSDTYEVNKKMALELLNCFPAEVLLFNDEKTMRDLLDRCFLLSESHRPPDCSIAASTFSLIVACSGAETTVQRIYNEPNSSSCLIVCQKLLQRLDTQLAVAKKSILRASACGPMYGSLYCMRTLIIDQDLHTLSEGAESVQWKNLIKKLVSLCFEMNATVAPIVNSSSPEGHLPMDFETDIELPEEMEDMNIADEENSAMPKVTAQMVLLCAWRTVKEVSLTLGELAAKAPANDTSQYLLTYDLLLQIGEHFTSLLCETKHRGAFEQAYVGFCKLCSWLWKVPSGELPQLPSKWLEELLVVITTSDQEQRTSSIAISVNKMCTTRRSAGVPFIVQALITTELDVRTKPECFHKTVKTLLVVAKDSGSAGQLHALNILRTLFRSAHLGEHVASYVSEGFVVAINAFKSINWAERNAATLLFSALMGRVFGVKHTPGHEDLPRKNRMTGRIFFRLYPDLFNLISSELKSVAESITKGCEVSGSLYPVLLLLARLYPSSLEGTDSALNLLSLLDYVSICTASPVMHTRELAANALVPLVEPQQASKYIQSVKISPQSQNILHGKLLQLSKLSRSIAINSDVKSSFEEKIKEGLYLISEEHKCPVTKGAFIDMILEFSKRCQSEHDFILKSLLLQKLAIVLEKEVNFGSIITQQKAARLWLHLSLTLEDYDTIKATVCTILSHPRPEIVQEACVFILSATQPLPEEISGNFNKLLELKCNGGHLTNCNRLKESSKVALLLIQKVLEFTPKEGQAAQFEARIAVYFACLRLSRKILQVDWNHDKVVKDPEEKIGLILQFIQEKRLGSANHAAIALVGELLNNLNNIPSQNIVEQYSTALLDCALADVSTDSNLIVAQSLGKNKRILFDNYEISTATSFCTVMIILQISSPFTREIVLQLCPSMVGATKSRATEALAIYFTNTNISLELKIATLLVWILGDRIFMDENSAQVNFEEQEKVFEQGEVAVSSEEVKLSEAGAIALKTLTSNHHKEVCIAINQPLPWIPFGASRKEICCIDILKRAVVSNAGQETHFLNYQHNLCLLRSQQFRELEKTGILDILS